MRTTQPGESALLLLDAVDLMNKRGVSYAVIGAMAASFYGVVRASLDADAVLSLTADSLPSFEAQFKEAGFQTERRQGGEDDPIAAVMTLKDSHGNRVDLLVGIRGLDPGAFSRVVVTSFEGESLRMIGLEDFIAMKLSAGSPKDLEDARQAFAVSKEKLDVELLKQLTARFGKETRQLLVTLFNL